MTQQDSDTHSNEEMWYRWSPETAANCENAALARAVAEFVSLDTTGGKEAERWFKHEALGVYPSIVTYVVMQGQRIDGFYGITGTQVRLSQRERRRLFRSYDRPVAPAQPASLVTRFARHRDARVPFRSVLLHAVHTAVRVGELQGNVALVLDPYEAYVSDLLQRRYGFRIASGEESESSPRLWLPLPGGDDVYEGRPVDVG